MVFHCMRGEIEPRRNFLVAQPLRDEAQHIQLARREGDAFLGQGSRCRGRDPPLAHPHIGFLGLVHEQDLRIGLDQRREPAPRDRVGHVEVDAQLHVSPASTRSTSGAGTASATPDTTIAATPITRPCTSASGPPEFPGARRTSAWIQSSEPLPFSPYPRGNGLTAWSTPTLTASVTPNGWPTAKTKEPDRRRSEEHTSELQSPCNLVCRLLLEKKKKNREEIDAGDPYSASSYSIGHWRQSPLLQ